MTARASAAPSQAQRHVRVYVWTCPPAERGMRPYWCRSVPCHGHRALGGDVIVAKALAWFAGVRWDDIDASRLESHEKWIRQARRFRAEVMGDTRRPR